MNKLWNFLNSQVGLLILGFLLTSILGTIITDRIQENNKEKDLLIERERQAASWERDKKYELFRRKLDDGEKLIDELSNLMNTRFFKMQNTFVSISQGNMTNIKWDEYYKSVEEWNIKVPVIQNKIRRLISDSLSMALNNYETDDPNLTKPSSIHGMFFMAHKELLKYYSNRSTNRRELSDVVNNRLRELDIQTDAYIDLISDTYLNATLNFENHLDSLQVK